MPSVNSLPKLVLPLFLIVSLFWPAILNHQPFLFNDTTAYVRAGDMIAVKASGGRLTSEWTQTDGQVPVNTFRTSSGPEAEEQDYTVKRVNDASSGTIMGGRSPYFGAILYLSSLVFNFWSFVVVHALTSYYLIARTTSFFGVNWLKYRAAIVLFLAVFSSIAFFNGTLLADALAAFGLLSAMLLIFFFGPASLFDRIAFLALAALSAIAHLTHILVILAIGGAGVILILLPATRHRISLPGLVLVFAAAGIGLGSVALTNAVVQHTFGKSPQLVPLLTARFIGDGPGARFIEEHCPDAGFAVCDFKGRISTEPNAFLWSPVPGKGVFMIATQEQRKLLSEQDKAFALAVLQEYPAAQFGKLLANTARQFADIQNHILNYDCERADRCWDAAPPSVGQRMVASISGRRGWPIPLIDTLHYAGVFAALAIFIFVWTRRQHRPDLTAQAFLGVLLFALLANAFLGGAISEVQGRYQGRVAWLLPMLASILFFQVIQKGPKARQQVDDQHRFSSIRSRSHG